MSLTQRPAPAEPHLIRPRLHARLDQGVQGAVTLVRAGPGWGKTTLVAGWAGGRSRPVAWLTLRRRHATAATFCAGVAAALNAPAPVSDEAGLRRLVAGLRRPVTVVLDDLHAVDGSPALRVLAGLIRRRPPGLRLVLLSRTMPDLPLHVPRSTGGLVELGAGDLRFGDAEAAELIALFPAGTDPAEVVRLAEGWPLALRLAAGAHGADPGGVIGNYLGREVIARQSRTARQFLLRTSVLDEVTPGLADALTGSTASDRVLAALDRTTGLVDGSRLHGQLRAEARRMLEREMPDEVARLHARAARWYAGQRRAPEAVRHAADAGDWKYLSHLVVAVAPGISLSPDRAVFAEALQRIPPELLLTTPEFIVCAAMTQLLNGDFQALPELLVSGRELLAGRPPAARLAAATMLDLIEIGAVMRTSGDMPAMVSATAGVLDRMRHTDPADLPIAPQAGAVAKIFRGMALIWTLRFDEARRHLREGMTEARRLGMPLTAANAEGHLALLAYFDGYPHEAERQACASYEQAERLGATSTVQATAAYLALALVEVERDHPTRAQTQLRNARRSEADPPEATLAVVAMVVRVHMALTAGDPAAATAALRQARADMVPTLRAPLITRWLDAVQCEIDLLAGEPARVVDRLTGAPRLSPHELLVLGRAHLALGEPATGTELLHRAAAGAGPLIAIPTWIMLALAAEARHDAPGAVVAAARAVALADAERVHHHFRTLGAGHLLRPEPEQALAEPLSERELEVLGFLPTLLTAQEIAEELGVSVNTIKAHLRAIYRKLDVARRREAVARTAELNLLP